MNDNSYLKHGDWNALCDICGFKFKASQLRKNWKGEMVCDSDWEMRHPQELIRVSKDDPHVPWARPDNDGYPSIPACYLWDQSCYAGLATAGCAQAGYTPLPSIQLYALKFPPLPF